MASAELLAVQSGKDGSFHQFVDGPPNKLNSVLFITRSKGGCSE